MASKPIFRRFPNLFRLFLRRERKIYKIFKESRRDPLFYLGVFSGILLLAFSFVLAPIFRSSRAPERDLSLLASASQISAEKAAGPFVASGTKSRPESPEFILVGNSGLKAASPLGLVTPQILGSIIGDFDPVEDRKTIIEYIIEPGESLASIAEKFSISLNTILWANNLKKNSVIQPGQKLIIPPVSGVIHLVKAGETVSEIAQLHQAKPNDIVSFNELSSEADIYVGDMVIVPNGVMPKPKVQSPVYSAPLASSYFICPIGKPCNITQGLHWYNAVDFSNGQCGDPIYAAAGGEVLKVKLTKSTSRSAFGGAGNHLAILHPNGVVTSYGHILSSLVEPGEQVSQGQIIALMGGQPGTQGAGKTTGCHVHFGVTGAKNPFAR